MKAEKFLITITICGALAGCPLDGDDGNDGNGATGLSGINCWDLNEDGINDVNEDVNGDGAWSVADCGGTAVAAAPQNTEVTFNHQHFCEAFANLNQYPAGCPSAIHTPPTGTLVHMIQGQFDDMYDTCSDLSVETTTDSTGTSTEAYWTLQGGYIGSIQPLYDGDRLECGTLCENDADCVAAYFRAKPTTQSGDCNLFYHSDSLTEPYKHFCGIGITTQTVTLTAEEVCLSSLDSLNEWWATCP